MPPAKKAAARKAPAKPPAKAAARKPAPKKSPAKKPAARRAPAKRKPATQSKPPKPTVAAVEAELAELAKLDQALAGSAFAATALAMAREIDKADNSATSKANCARVLTEAMNRLHELAPEEEKPDGVDALAQRRAARRAAA